jgi:hypothetical protein
MKNDDIIGIGTGLTDYFLGLAQFPPLATVVTLTAKTAFLYVSQLKEQNFMKRLRAFFTETQKTTDKERIEFLQKLGDDQKEFWDKTLLVLERLDDENKATMIGKLCSALILKQITVDQYHRAALIVDRSYSFDLDFFYEFFKGYLQTHSLEYGKESDTSTIVNNLVMNGLMTNSSGQVGHLPTGIGLIIFHHALK